MSGAPPGYNANESLLAGGTSPIAHVMGGGAQRRIKRALHLIRKKFSKRAKGHSRTKRTRRRQRGGVTGHYVLSSDTAYKDIGKRPDLRVQKLPEPTDATNAPPAAGTSQYAEYTKIATQPWKRSVGGSGVIATTSKVELPKDTSKGISSTGTDRLSIILPYSINKIVVFPPIEGSLDKFKAYIALAFTAGKEVKGTEPTCYIFTCPFFSDDTETNKELFEYFIDTKLLIHAKSSRLYILTEFSADHLNQSKELTKETPGNKDTTPIYPLLEPSYIVYPYGINIKAIDSEGKDMLDVPDDSCRGLLFSGAAANEPDLPKADSSMDGLVAVLFKDPLISSMNGNGAAGAAVVTDVISSVAYKPDITVPDPKLDAMNFRIVRARDDMESSIYYVYNRGEIGPSAQSDLDGFSSIFLENEHAYTEDVPLVSVELGTQNFSLRSPLPQVREDWKNAIFTREESNFLNSLNINPVRLSSIFGDVWKETLERNLAIIARSKCFTDSSLLLHVECQETQSFIAKIFNNFVENAEDILDMERNQMQSTIANLTAEVIQQKNGSSVRGGKDLYKVQDFEAAFCPPGNPDKFRFEKNEHAEIKMHVMPGFIGNQFSIDTLVIDLQHKKHYKSTLLMTLNISAGPATEKQISDGRDAVTKKYREIKKATEVPAKSAAFPRFQIILPE